MSDAAARPESVLEAILRWSNTRPLWLRDALRRVVQQPAITDKDIEELKSICLAEHGTDLAFAKATAKTLIAADLPSSPTAANSVSLVSISAVESANQLAPGQTLTIAPAGLTVVYGDNGAGKSGYSRILKRSCRARNRGDQIEPDIFATTPKRGAKARIDYQTGATPKSVAWSDGPNPMVPELSAISVFDSECAAIHVEEKNDVAFRPHGLDVPERLASTCQRLKTSLEADGKAAAAERDAVFHLPTWTATTSVGKILSSLRHDTNFASLEKLAVMSDAEKKRLKDLREDLSKDPAAAAKEIRLRIGRLKAVATYLETVEAQTSDTKLSELSRLVAESRTTRDAARVAAESLFAGSLLTGKVRAELTYAGGKAGTPQYQVRLIARPSADVADVLSEGESKCVALAGFMTELATADHRSAIIFDDPVSSLDHKWRQKVAKRLAKEGRTRQVVVLTHDIVFVHDLHDHAKTESVSCELRNLRRDSTGTGVVGDGLPWLGMKVEARLDDLGKRARAARTLFDGGDEEAYNREVEGIYSDLRATWERALEDVAFQRTVLRHRDYINSEYLRKVSVLTLQDCEDFRKHFHKCCDLTNSHDRSPGRNPEHPEPTELLADIKALEEWVGSLRDRQKAI